MSPKHTTPNRCTVLQLTTVHTWNDIRIYSKIARTLADAGLDVHLLAPKDPKAAGAPESPVKVHWFERSSNRVARFFSSFRVIRRVRQIKPEVVHFHDPELIPSCIVLQLMGYKVIYDVHEHVPDDILTKTWIPWILRFPTSLAARAVEYAASRIFSANIVVTRHIGKRFPKKKTVLLQNYPQLSEFSNFDQSSDRMYTDMIYIGGMTPIRGIREMISGFAMASTPDRQLQIMGTTQDSELQSWLETKQKELPITLNGWCDRETVRQKMNNALAGLLLYLPNKAHCMALPTKMFEYMSGGVAIIASNYPLWEDIFDQFKCGRTVDPEDPKAIAETIDWFYRNPNEARKMGDAGRRAVEAKMNWEVESHKLLELYQKLIPDFEFRS